MDWLKVPPHTLHAVCEPVYLLTVVYTGRSNLSFPACVCVSVLLIQDSAGRSRCKLVTQTRARRLASPPNTPLCGPKNSNRPARSINKSSLPVFIRHARTDVVHSQWNAHALAHISSVEAPQPDSRIYYVMIGAVILKLYICLCNRCSHQKVYFLLQNTISNRTVVCDNALNLVALLLLLLLFPVALQAIYIVTLLAV